MVFSGNKECRSKTIWKIILIQNDFVMILISVSYVCVSCKLTTQPINTVIIDTMLVLSTKSVCTFLMALLHISILTLASIANLLGHATAANREHFRLNNGLKMYCHFIDEMWYTRWHVIYQVRCKTHTHTRTCTHIQVWK